MTELFNLISNNKFNKIKNILNKNHDIIYQNINNSKNLIHISIQFNKIKLFKKIININPEQLLNDIKDTKLTNFMIAQQTGIYSLLKNIIDITKEKFPDKIKEQINKKEINNNTLIDLIIQNNNLDDILNFIIDYNDILDITKNHLLIFIKKYINNINDDKIKKIIESMMNNNNDILINNSNDSILYFLLEMNIFNYDFIDYIISLDYRQINIKDDDGINFFIYPIIKKDIKLLNILLKYCIKYNQDYYNNISNYGEIIIFNEIIKSNNINMINSFINLDNIDKSINFIDDRLQSSIFYCFDIKDNKIDKNDINYKNKKNNKYDKYNKNYKYDKNKIKKDEKLKDEKLKDDVKIDEIIMDNKMMNKKKIIEIIMSKTEDLNIKNINGNNIWHLIFNKDDYMNYLIYIEQYGGDIYSKNKMNIRPLDNLNNKIKNNDKYKEIKNDIIEKFARKYREILYNDKKNEYYKPEEIKDAIKKNNINDIINYIKKIKNSYPIKNNDLIDINIIENDYSYYNLYNARDWDIYSYIILLLKKYDDLGVPYENTETFDKNKIISLDNKDDDEYITTINNYLNNWSSYPIFYNISIYWYNKTSYSIPYNFINNILNSFNYNKNFIIIRLDIINKIFHSNILLIDNLNKFIIRFEPQGGILIDDSLDIDNILSNFFLNNKYFKNFIYMKPTDYMPLNGFQAISNEINHYNMKKGDMGGFCSAWCLLFVELYIKNIDIIKKYGLKTFFNKTMKKMINSQYMVTEQIRNYANHLHKKQNEFLLKNNFEYEKLYNYRFNSSDYTKLLKLLSTSIENNIIN